MASLEVIKQAQTMELVDEDGEVFPLTLLPGLSEVEVDAFASSLPCPLPRDVRELLRFCRGFEGTVMDVVDFTGAELFWSDERIFPCGLPIASDGFGNFWVVDLSPDAGTFGPIYFACHDPPIVLYQSHSLTEFLTEVFKACTVAGESLIDDVHEDRIHHVWQTNPNVLPWDACMRSPDAELSAFAATLNASWQIIDLRDARPGMGFSWGRYGARTNVCRHGYASLFAYQKRGLWRLLR